jgi:hypothetical protein
VIRLQARPENHPTAPTTTVNPSGFRKSLLILNAYFQDPALTQRSDSDIAKRSGALLGYAPRLWPRPSMPAPVAVAPSTSPPSA